MRPTSNSANPAEDLHSILNRFHNWAGKQPENHNGRKPNSAGVREIPMEEAIRQLRSRRATSMTVSTEKRALTQPQEAPAGVETEAELAPQVACVNRPVAAVEKATESLGTTAQENPPAKTTATPTKKPAKKREKTRPAAAAATAQQPARKPAAVDGSGPKTARKEARLAAPVCAPKKLPAKVAFREVLARSLPAQMPDKKPERQQRISVRLSRAEERQLQELASQGGITVSEYLRRTALPAKTADCAPRTPPKARMHRGRAATAAPLFATSTSENSSVLGGWLTLLRNRFLSSPTRFAERA